MINSVFKIVQGILKLRGNTDNTLIGNISDTISINDVNKSAVWTTIGVTNTSVEAKVGGSRLTNRSGVRIYNDSNNTVYFGYSSGVTTAGATKGELLLKGESIDITFSVDQGVWLIAASGTNNCIVSEFAK